MGILIMNKKLTAIVVAATALLLLFFVKPGNVQATTTDSSNDPIIFVPGAFDNDEGWDNMMTLIDPNAQHSVTKLNAMPNGQVLRKDIRTVNNGQRPIVILSFQVNAYKENVISKDANALRDALSIYNQKTPFTNADIIGHSNGGSITTTYLEQNATKPGFKFHFNHFISAGTPYNFQAGNGAANTPFLNILIANSSQLPKDLQVTNIIGSNATSDASDGVVSRDSAMSGSKIFDGKVATFKQIHISGDDALHANQASSPQVASIIESTLGL
ncbi:alpha/beta hydrolase [Lactobacillus salsicarnum]|nr:alpha/beta hydrolase [Companilactobacillus mishanensis]